MVSSSPVDALAIRDMAVLVFMQVLVAMRVSTVRLVPSDCGVEAVRMIVDGNLPHAREKPTHAAS